MITFKEIITNLETMEVKYDEEDLELNLLCSLPSSYMTFRDTSFYSYDTLIIDKVYDTLISKEKMKHLVIGLKSHAEGLVIRGKNQDMNLGGNMRDGSKFKHREKVFFFCKRK